MNTNNIAVFGTVGSTYIGVAALLVANSFGLPLPEEVILVLGGAAAFQGAMRLYILMPLAGAAILIADFGVYWLGRLWGRPLLRHRFFRLIVSPERVRQFSRKYEGHMLRGIFTVRFLSGLRAPAYFAAGTLNLPAHRFVATDALALLIHVPLYTTLGFLFSAQLDAVLETVKAANRRLAVLAITAVVTMLLYGAYRLIWYRKSATPSG